MLVKQLSQQIKDKEGLAGGQVLTLLALTSTKVQILTPEAVRGGRRSRGLRLSLRT
jgi:hypothetical protein